jgi:hypothetical protein
VIADYSIADCGLQIERENKSAIRNRVIRQSPALKKFLAVEFIGESVVFM